MEPWQYMARTCPDWGETIYACKILGRCDRECDQAIFESFERVTVRRHAPPTRQKEPK